MGAAIHRHIFMVDRMTANLKQQIAHHKQQIKWSLYEHHKAHHRRACERLELKLADIQRRREAKLRVQGDLFA